MNNDSHIANFPYAFLKTMKEMCYLNKEDALVIMELALN